LGKIYKLKAEEIQNLTHNKGGCMATDKITVEGMEIGYMYRDEPSFDKDSGWRFFSGTEDQDYVDDPNNIMIYNVNTIANYDAAIIPYLNLPCGTELERLRGTNEFQIIPG
jgi:hypothetical protein